MKKKNLFVQAANECGGASFVTYVNSLFETNEIEM